MEPLEIETLFYIDYRQEITKMKPAEEPKKIVKAEELALLYS